MTTQGTPPYTPEAERQFGRDEPRGTGAAGYAPRARRRRDKPFFLTSEFLTLVAAVAAVCIAAAIANNFGANQAWTLVTVLAASYMISRGLAKAGREEDVREVRIDR
jgi:hypothetical protein